MYNPLDFIPVNALEFTHSFQVQIAVATRSDILRVIDGQYGLGSAAATFTSSLETATKNEGIVGAFEKRDLEVELSSESKPLIKLTNLILSDAVVAGASDIHVEALPDSVKVRYRVDGVLLDQLALPGWVQSAVVSRFKVMANLDISQRRVPQDGRLNLLYRGRSIDVRVSTLPTQYGEKVVLRLLERTKSIQTLEGLGLTGRNLKVVTEALQSPQGLILTTGPTGSGKSSTLQVAIGTLRTGEDNIITVEDPIEYRIPGVTQVQINERANFTFPSALRSILRQDPDVIMVGEIRDQETAELVFHAAQTGHLVLSTLHTNDSVSTLPRLAELGVDRSLVAESLLVAMAQRLARRNCPHCLETYTPSRTTLHRLGLSTSEIEFTRGRGCEKCRNTGYRGRIGFFEVLSNDPHLSNTILKGATLSELRAEAVERGMEPLYEDAIRRVREGIVNAEEVLRAIHVEEESRDASATPPVPSPRTTKLPSAPEAPPQSLPAPSSPSEKPHPAPSTSSDSDECLTVILEDIDFDFSTLGIASEPSKQPITIEEKSAPPSRPEPLPAETVVAPPLEPVLVFEGCPDSPAPGTSTKTSPRPQLPAETVVAPPLEPVLVLEECPDSPAPETSTRTSPRPQLPAETVVAPPLEPVLVLEECPDPPAPETSPKPPPQKPPSAQPEQPPPVQPERVRNPSRPSTTPKAATLPSRQPEVPRPARAEQRNRIKPPELTVRSPEKPARQSETKAGRNGNLPGQLGRTLDIDERFRILVVDDDLVMLNNISLLLRRLRVDTELKVAINGLKAWEQIKEKAPHLIILDLLMPEMDGYELLDRLRTDIATAYIPVVVVTSTSPAETRDLAERVGADAYLTKPFNPRDLEACVRGFLTKVYAGQDKSLPSVFRN
jgi:type II secretory ATPase GspE/PulE/Tfp pilus assembly ATPase PilB-like protein/ActR/RegA family two-component response regulator